ncbi:MAG: VWA domain-containing protein [Phycisphaerae bacterium]|nr:VWA domain-containing protein [Phycisphaerae bacterium]NUQ44753.1 VWA domain-containing protein [Phycisphaerae bacterium]
MRYEYVEWDGREFPTQDRLDLFHSILDFVLAHGDEAMRALDRADLNDAQREWLDQLIKDGLLEKVAGRWKLTPRAIGAMQRRALNEVFRDLRAGRRDGHVTVHPGGLGERTEGTRRYEFGDPISELDPTATLRNALSRGGTARPIRVGPQDFEVYNTEAQSSVSLVILLDQSGSMARYGRYPHAKKCAMALHALVRQQYPFDTVDIIGFSSAAAIIPEHKLPLTSPKPVTIFDPHVRIRVPIAQVEKAPQHFTNLHMGLAMARQLLTRRGGENKQVFIITDGEPTAHVQGEFIHLIYPPDQTSVVATLKEAARCAADGIRVATFALIEDYAYMDWVGFVDQLTKLTKGVAFYCASGDLSSCIMESFLSGRRVKSYIA